MYYQIQDEIVDSWMCHWPFLDSITGDWTDLIDYIFTRKGPGGKCRDHEGAFEMLDLRKTSQASGSLVADPGKTNDHHYL